MSQQPSTRANERVDARATYGKLSLEADDPQVGHRHKVVERK